MEIFAKLTLVIGVSRRVGTLAFDYATLKNKLIMQKVEGGVWT